MTQQEKELHRLREDNERLRWRHPLIIPEWNDLPQKLRTKLCDIGEHYDELYGRDNAHQVYSEIRDALNFSA